MEHVDPVVSARMAKIRNRDTKPELLLRRELRALHLGYRVSIRPIPELARTGDIVFVSAKVVVMVDGCFWHGCPLHYRPSRKSEAFWTAKIKSNIARDVATNICLAQRGWLVVRVWEHEDAKDAAAKIAAAVRARRAIGRGRSGAPQAQSRGHQP